MAPLLRTVTALFLYCIVGAAQAHVGSNSLEKRVGEYLVDIGYDAAQFVSGRPVTFTFTGMKYPNEDNWEFVDMTEVRVKVTKEGVEPFETALKVDAFTPPVLSHTFPEEGTYTFAVAYLEGENTVVATEFSVPVVTPGTLSATSWPMIVGYGLVGLLFLVFGMLLVRDFRRVPHP